MPCWLPLLDILSTLAPLLLALLFVTLYFAVSLVQLFVVVLFHSCAHCFPLLLLLIVCCSILHCPVSLLAGALALPGEST